MNNKGYTLVELLVSMAITAVVVTIVISFLVTNSKNYTYASEEVNLQMESQTVMNQLYENIIEANWLELKDVNSDKALLIYRSTGIDVVFLNTADKCLYLVENLTKSDVADLSVISYQKDENLMATNLSDMSMYPADDESLIKDKQITLYLKFENTSLQYNVEQNIQFRNRLVKP